MTKPTPRPSKKTQLIKLLGRSKGAAMNELEIALGWQSHSVRAAISGLRKSGHTIERTTTKSGPRYHLSKSLEKAARKAA